MNPLQQKIGIIGGGQLGKMMIQAASKLDFHVTILDPTPDCPAHPLADEHIVAAFDDEDAIRQLADQTDLVTYEFEHIGIEVLISLEDEGYNIYPTAKSLKIIQNKLTQNQTLFDAKIEVPAFAKVETPDDIRNFATSHNYPLLLKSCYGGYDGKGNRVVVDSDDVDTAFNDLMGQENLLLVEEFVDFVCEISVIATRDKEGNVRTLPIAENLHRENILIQTTVPAAISEQAQEKAIGVAEEVLQIFNGIGTFCTEMFVTKDDGILVNEIAPRPHNSGHFSIEACTTSQFEQHIRAITGLPLGATNLLTPAMMINIIGDRGPQPANYYGIDEAMAISGVNPHIYGKSTVKPGRKMGHITTIGDTISNIRQNAHKASELVGFED